MYIIALGVNNYPANKTSFLWLWIVTTAREIADSHIFTIRIIALEAAFLSASSFHCEDLMS